MEINNKWVLWLLAATAIYFCFVYLSDIILYVSLGIILAFIGRPIVNFLTLKKFFGIRISRTLASFFCLFLIALLSLSITLLFIPLISEQVAFFSSINFNILLANVQAQASNLILKLIDLNLWPSTQDWERIINKILDIVSTKKIGEYFGSALSTSSSILITIFSMFFIAFFLLKDATLLRETIFALTPDRHTEKMGKSIDNIKELLSRYFVGLIIQVSIITLMIWAGLAMIGIENALILGIISGLLNLIPYIGPLMSIILGLLLGITSELAIDLHNSIGILSLKILVVYLITLTIDNIITQPIIFSKSVKAHPLEIFLLVLIAGTLFGIIGMIAAIPVYTILRVIAREFFPELKIVKKITESMHK